MNRYGSGLVANTDNRYIATMSRISAEQTVSRFDTAAAAAKYSNSLIHTRTDRREQRCIRRALANVPAGSSVLDIPCGAGRLLPLLCGLGYRVTAADSSAHMLEWARQCAQMQSLPIEQEDFHTANIFDTGFADHHFDAVVCNRLFHHFGESQTRQRALRELKRISHGPIILSFFCNWSLDAATFWLKHLVRHTQPTDRIPTWLHTIDRDIRAAECAVHRRWATRWGISRQWYLLIGPETA